MSLTYNSFLCFTVPGDVPAFAPVVVNFAAGVGSQVVSIPITNDTLIESNEVFEVVLNRTMDNTVFGSPNTANIIIQDDDCMLL